MYFHLLNCCVFLGLFVCTVFDSSMHTEAAFMSDLSVFHAVAPVMGLVYSDVVVCGPGKCHGLVLAMCVSHYGIG
jgi:hypothetical protein